MTTKKPGPRPAAIHPKVAAALVDKLATDDAFRSRFQDDPSAALKEVGYTVAEGEGDVGECLALSGAPLASREDFARDRERFDSALVALPFGFTFDCPPGLKA
jgi:putative modified peptide